MCSDAQGLQIRYPEPMGRDGELDWDDLRHFLHAARAGSLAGAARALGVEHTTIGRRLTALEAALGAPLVLRGADGLTLTALGEKALPLVNDVERAVLAVADLLASRRSRVRLAVPSGFTALFTGALGRLRREHPEVSLELLSGARPADLEHGEADLAVRAGPVVRGDLIARRLCDVGWALYASEAYLARRPVDPGDLAGHDVIGFHGAAAGSPAARWLEQRTGASSIALRSREMSDMLVAVSSGLGLAVLPCMLGDPEPGLRRLTREVVATSALSVVYRPEARRSRAVRAVLRFVVDTVHAQRDRIAGTRARR